MVQIFSDAVSSPLWLLIQSVGLVCMRQAPTECLAWEELLWGKSKKQKTKKKRKQSLCVDKAFIFKTQPHVCLFYIFIDKCCFSLSSSPLKTMTPSSIPQSSHLLYIITSRTYGYKSVAYMPVFSILDPGQTLLIIHDVLSLNCCCVFKILLRTAFQSPKCYLLVPTGSFHPCRNYKSESRQKANQLNEFAPTCKQLLTFSWL